MKQKLTCDSVPILYSLNVEDPKTLKSIDCNCQAPKPEIAVTSCFMNSDISLVSVSRKNNIPQAWNYELLQPLRRK